MKILLAIDGSQYTKKALDFVANHPAMFVTGHQFVLVNVCAGIPGHVARHVSKEAIQDYYAEEANKVLAPVKALMAERNLSNYTVDTRHGHAAEEILGAAKDNSAELIVMGTRGHGVLGRAIMGSVATKVITESDIPVLLVK